MYSKSSSPPPPGPDSLYADPNTIAAATGEEYAMVDVKGKKKKQTQQAVLHQVRAEHYCIPYTRYFSCGKVFVPSSKS